ncbi:Protease 2 [Clavibacter michiganensis]|uniref:Protease 2 n=1 Tax=Clavibacter michiganensis TaxID=28447 RepID=A0A251Y835_9MICO|nr:prolyl oligopeptidase family serine peptidase [Clavibacter michiganensis]OUE20401.1 Protease 2 [Clavibacter michiganensis]
MKEAAQDVRADEAARIRVANGDPAHDERDWLRDTGSDRARAWFAEENRRTRERTSHLSGITAQLQAEFAAREVDPAPALPVRKGAWWYFSRTQPGRQYPAHLRVAISDEGEWTPPLPADPRMTEAEVVFDGDVEAAGSAYFGVGTFDVSRDGRTLAYSVDRVGDERYELRVRDLTTGVDKGPVIPDTCSGATLSADGTALYFVTADRSRRPDVLWSIPVGDEEASPERVHHEPDPRFRLRMTLTRSGRFLLLISASQTSSETSCLDMTDATARPAVIRPRRPDVLYYVDHAVVDGEDRFLILHDEVSRDGSLVDVPCRAPDGPQREVLPASSGVSYESVTAFAGFVLVTYRRAGLRRVGVLSADGGSGAGRRSPYGELVEVPLLGDLLTCSSGGNPDWSQPTVRIASVSFTQPRRIHSYDPATHRCVLLSADLVKGYDPAAYTEERLWAPGDDGTMIPISMLYKTEAVQVGVPSPTVMYVYGAYGASVDPHFSSARVSLLDRGVVFAVAHVRGGGELGHEWYRSGRRRSKATSITDFIACIDHLLLLRRTSASMLAVTGGSAGGLVVGAAVNRAGERFAAALAQVPFVDPLTTMLDPALPLTILEREEWGDPLNDMHAYGDIRDYSPYDNVRRRPQPPRVLAVTGAHDARVSAGEPAKWVARLRDHGVDALLRVDDDAGHRGSSGLEAGRTQVAFEYAWLLDAVTT